MKHTRARARTHTHTHTHTQTLHVIHVIVLAGKCAKTVYYGRPYETKPLETLARSN